MEITSNQRDVLIAKLIIYLEYMPPLKRLNRYIDDWIDESMFVLNKEHKNHQDGAYFYGFVGKIGDVTNYLN